MARMCKYYMIIAILRDITMYISSIFLPQDSNNKMKLPSYIFGISLLDV